MRRKKAWLAILISILLLTGCGDSISQNSNTIKPTLSSTGISQNRPTSEQSSTQREDSHNDDSIPPAEGMVRSKLTNEWITEDAANLRSLAVIIPNESAAIPHYNLSEASILYEANVEGRMTRLMAIYEDWVNLEKIGNIRSLRTYYAYWALEWDALIVHWGGPYFVTEVLNKPNVENLDGNTKADTVAFFRSADRQDPHNVYTDGAGLKQLILDKDYSLTQRGLTDDRHYLFTSRTNPNTLSQYADAKDAVTIDMSGCYPLTRCYFEYHEEEGLYYRFQHLSGSTDGPHVDAATGEQLTFSNILVQYVKQEELGEGYLAFQCHDTTRDGWFFTNGKGIHVTWEKIGDFGATRYFDDNGNEITLNTGKTMVLIIEEGDRFSFS